VSFFPNIFFFKKNNFIGEAPFLCSHKGIKRGEAEKNIAFHSSLPYFSLSTMHDAIGDTVLPNSFSKTA
jgi:hypothetical protein